MSPLESLSEELRIKKRAIIEEVAKQPHRCEILNRSVDDALNTLMILSMGTGENIEEMLKDLLVVINRIVPETLEVRKQAAMMRKHGGVVQ